MLGAVKACAKKVADSVKKALSHYVKFKLVDDCGNPMPGVKVSVTLPDKAIQERVSDAKGMIHIYLATAGACTVDLDWKDKKLSDTVLLQS